MSFDRVEEFGELEFDGEFPDETSEISPERAAEQGEHQPGNDLLQRFMKEAGQFPLLDHEEVIDLSRTSKGEGKDAVAAYKTLAECNLRWVIKIALEYQNYWMRNILDLIQEGNIGLMRAIRKFDPERGIKFSYFSSFWIKAYILRFLIDNWSSIKLGTTQSQRRLFYNLRKEQDNLRRMGFEPDPDCLSERLNVPKGEIISMDQRLRRDLSLDNLLAEGSSERHADFLVDSCPLVDEVLLKHQENELIHQLFIKFRVSVDLCVKETDILDLRLLAHKPLTLQQLADKHDISRERIRQIEYRLKEKVRDFLSAELGTMPSAGEIEINLKHINLNKIKEVFKLPPNLTITHDNIATFVKEHLRSLRMKKTFFLLGHNFTRQQTANKLGINMHAFNGRRLEISRRLTKFFREQLGGRI